MEPRNARAIRRRPELRRPGEPGKPAPTIDDLRRILVGPEQGRLERLEERPAVSSESVGQVLPEALAVTSGRRRDELSIALEPPLTSALRTVARREADFLGELLSPTIGAAVRKAVADAFAAMMQRFNEALERSLSVRSIRWRLEAKRTGQPFAEIVLLRTLEYRVEEVFLIHTPTGLVLERAAAAGAGVLDPDQVSSMLEAIDAFVHEAFAPLPGGVHLRRIELGGLFVWVERAADVAVAALVRGSAPQSFGDVLRETRERIHLTQREELARFESNVAPFAVTRPLLERCLVAQRRSPPQRAHIWLALAAAIALVAGGLAVWIHHAQTRAQARVLDASVAALASEPGIVVTAADRANGRVRVRGLRDPLATAPVQVLAARGLPAAELELAPFASLDARIVERRAIQKLRPPPGVSLSVEGDVLRAHGVAPLHWIERARALAPALAGVERYDDGELRAEEALAALGRATDDVQAATVIFPVGSSDARAGRGLDEARERALRLFAAAADARRPACVSVVGHTDPSGRDADQQPLAERRARTVADDLIAHGVDPRAIRAVGAGVWRDAPSPERARSVTFDVGAECGGGP